MKGIVQSVPPHWLHHPTSWGKNVLRLLVQAETEHLRIGTDTRLTPSTDGPRWYCSTSPVSFLHRAQMTAAWGQTACFIFTPHFDNVCFWLQFRLQRKANTPHKASILFASNSVLTPRWIQRPLNAVKPAFGSVHWPDGCDLSGGCVSD